LFLAQHRLLVATSMTDALTGIPNRRQLKADLDRGLKQASRAKPLLLMLFDLNGFKAYNGHLRPPRRRCPADPARRRPRPSHDQPWRQRLPAGRG
jgi:hypothetical protein